MTTTATPTTRPVARVYGAPGLHMVGDGFRVMGYMGAYPELARALDPFLLIDYHPPYDYAPTMRPRHVSNAIRPALIRMSLDRIPGAVKVAADGPTTRR